MQSWQKRARFVLLVVGLAVVAVVFATTRRREEPPPAQPVARVDPTAVIETTGAYILQLKGEHQTFRVDAEKNLAYPDGRSRLIGAKITSVKQGKTFVAIGEEATVGPNQSSFDLNGNVHLTSSDGLEVRAGSATYNRSDGTVRAPGAVTFSRGRMTGSGEEFSYDEERDLLGLSDKTHVKIAGDAKEAPTEIRSGAAVLSRKEKFVSFERDVHIVRGNQVISADNALGELTDDDKLRSLDLQGRARIETPNAASGALKTMSGDIVKLAYLNGGDLLERALVTGSGAVQLAGDAGTPDRVLRGGNIDIGMAPDGSTVTSVNAHENVVLELPAPRGEPSKRVAAATLVATGAPGQGLTAATFSGNVDYQETGGKANVKRTVTARTLEASLAGGIGEIRDALFTGDARFKDATTSATASTMRYDTQSGRVNLSSSAGDALPRVVNEQMTVDAVEIEMSTEGSRLRANGNPARQVQSVMLPAKGGAKGARRQPGLMQQDQPVNGVSDTLVYAGGDAATAEFTGKVRLWQGEKADTVIQADAIVVDGDTGDLTAEGSVVSQMSVTSTNPETKARETARSLGAGQKMVYDDDARTVTYTTKARLVSAQGDLTGDEVVLTLGQNGRDVEKLHATGDVTMKEVDRLTTGDELTYVAATEEYNVRGKGRLVRMLRRTPEGCRRSDGSLITYSRLDDTLRIDGSVETRTQTSADSACPPAPPAKR